MRAPILFCATMVCVSCLGSTAAGADWLQFGYDPAHSSNNPDETAITRDNVASLQRRYQVTIPASVDSAPVYASAIDTPLGTKDLLFFVATNGKLMALDAADGSLVWSQDHGGTQPTSGSPAIDPNREFVYSYGLDGKVHKHQIGDGVEITTDGWPEISTLKTSVEKGAASLSFGSTGGTTYLYSVTDGYIGDGGDYQGHLTAIDLSTGTQNVFNTLCSDITIHMVLNGTNGVNDCSEHQSGIWGRPGATYDAATDRVYITTGNGLFDANTGGLNWGDSVLALNPDGTGMGAGFPMDSYTPTTYPDLDGNDIDLGSASLSILPVPPESALQHIGLQTGKDSRLHLINLDDMSGAGSPGNAGGELQDIPVPLSQFWMKTQPAIWVDANGDGATWVFVANGSGLSGLKLELDGSNIPFLQPTWTQTSNATSAIVANGIVYHAGSCPAGTCILARDPLSGDVLWTSPSIGGLHWQSPILVDGTIFIAAGSSLSRFDLGGVTVTHTVTPAAGPNGSIAPDTPQTVNDGATTAFTVTPDTHYEIADVTGCGGSLNGDTYTTGPVTADCTVNASFAQIMHTVTPAAGTGGSIDPATPQPVGDGDTIQFTVTPSPGYLIDQVTGCGGALAGDVYTTAPVSADCTVSATFVVDNSDFIFSNGFDGAVP